MAGSDVYRLVLPEQTKPMQVTMDNTQALHDDANRNAAILARIPENRWGSPDDFS